VYSLAQHWHQPKSLALLRACANVCWDRSHNMHVFGHRFRVYVCVYVYFNVVILTCVVPRIRIRNTVPVACCCVCVGGNQV
jgi:hypothetical protein